MATPPEETEDTDRAGAATAVPATPTVSLTLDEDEDEETLAPEDEDDLPVFEVSDRRASIAADRAGITFKLDGELAEFGWDEIGAVEIGSPRFGRRFSLTVYTLGRHRYQADVEAPSRGTLKKWAADLDAVLDARFEDAPEQVPEDADEAAPADAGTDTDETEANETEAKTEADAPADAEPTPAAKD